MLTTLINADEEEIYREMQEADEEMRFMLAHPHLQKVKDAFYFVMYAFAALYCKYTDHDICDTSYGGPDSGDISGYCRRCGWSYHTQLY